VSARYFNALCLLKRNEILKANFVRHWVRTRLDYNSARGRYKYWPHGTHRSVAAGHFPTQDADRKMRRGMVLETAGSEHS